MSQSSEEFQRQLDSEEQDEYYSLLNVDRQATPEDIRSAYRHLCLIYHPDRSVEGGVKCMHSPFHFLLL